MNDQQAHEATLMRTMARLDARLEVLHQDVGELKDGMYKLADACKATPLRMQSLYE